MDQKITYRIPLNKAESLYKEKGSKFLGFALPVNTEEDVKEELAALRKQFFDARHHCYAYVLGINGDVYRANDDGEPGHSAGDPILGQIRSADITNLLVVVVRYFGGTKLGVSGLINAYKTAAEEAIKELSVEEMYVTETYRINYGYDVTNEIMRVIPDYDLTVISQEFTDRCVLLAAVKISREEQFLAKLQLLKDMGMDLTFDRFVTCL